MTKKIRHLSILILLLFLLVGCQEDEEVLTVAEVWQNAAALDGQRIRVRGPGRLIYEPFHPNQVGGCSPEASANPAITGKAFLFEGTRDNPGREIIISPSSLTCEGNTCQVTCRPFQPPENLFGFVDKQPGVYEFVGTLQVETESGQDVLFLDKIDIKSSRRLIDGRWEPIPTGEFSGSFP